MSTRLAVALRRWVDSATAGAEEAGDARGIDWPRVVPFALMHVGCLAVAWTGWSPFAVATAVLLYALRMFAITAFYHRYFSHRAFRASRGWQFVFAVLGASAVQRGPLWWAAHHRHHHQHSDRPGDAHSVRQDGFFWSHMGWFLARENFATRAHLVRDLAKYPELRWLDRYDVAVPAALFVALWAVGAWLEAAHPSLGTGPWQLVVWGFCISTVVLFHSTFVINSVAHQWGTRRFDTGDDSRNNALLALITFGEGWHNNHHRYPGSARQGFYWWEVDLSWYALRVLAALGVVRGLRPVPRSVIEAGRRPGRGRL
ncbi:MAG: acyl-CoA desaturase [Steroidobacteraceae bacterium]